MKSLLALIAMLAFMGFTGTSVHAAAKPKHHKGHLVKVEGTTLTYKGGAKGKGKEHTVTTDASTKVTLDGKEVKLSEVKADTYIEITEENGVATKVVALTNPPKPKSRNGA